MKPEERQEERFYASLLELPGIPQLPWGTLFQDDMDQLIREGLLREGAGIVSAGPSPSLQRIASEIGRIGAGNPRERLRWYPGSAVEQQHPAVVLAGQAWTLELSAPLAWAGLVQWAHASTLFSQKLAEPLRRWNDRVSREARQLPGVEWPPDQVAWQLCRALQLPSEQPGSRSIERLRSLSWAMQVCEKKGKVFKAREMREVQEKRIWEAAKAPQVQSMLQEVLYRNLGRAHSKNEKRLAKAYLEAVEAASAGGSGSQSWSEADAEIVVSWGLWHGDAPWESNTRQPRNLGGLGVRIRVEKQGHDRCWFSFCELSPAGTSKQRRCS